MRTLFNTGLVPRFASLATLLIVAGLAAGGYSLYARPHLVIELAPPAQLAGRAEEVDNSRECEGGVSLACVYQ
ncbi:MAG: hypothetical protein ABI885_29565 [Gammaproteobacteria bacterium]